MKRWIYGTLAIFIGILIIMAVVSQRTPVQEVTYQNGQVVPKAR
jgi:hypothetical protein